MVQRPAVLAWLRLARVFQKIDRLGVEQMRGYGISLAQFDLLACIGASEGLTQQELADSLLVTKGNICQLLDRMEGCGLLQRRQCGRANRLHLTDKGRDLMHEGVPAHQDLICGTLSALTEGEQRQLLSLLRKLDHSLSN